MGYDIFWYIWYSKVVYSMGYIMFIFNLWNEYKYNIYEMNINIIWNIYYFSMFKIKFISYSNILYFKKLNFSYV